MLPKNPILSKSVRDDLAHILTTRTEDLKPLNPDEMAKLHQRYEEARAALLARADECPPEDPEQERQRIARSNYFMARHKLTGGFFSDKSTVNLQPHFQNFLDKKSEYLRTLPPEKVTLPLFSDPLRVAEKYRRAKMIQADLSFENFWSGHKDMLRRPEYSKAEAVFNEMFPVENPSTSSVLSSSEFTNSFSRLATLLQQKQHSTRNVYINNLLIEILIEKGQEKGGASEAELTNILNITHELITTRNERIAKKYETLADDLLLGKTSWPGVMLGLAMTALTIVIFALNFAFFPPIVLGLASVTGITPAVIGFIDIIAMFTTMAVSAATAIFFFQNCKSVPKPEIARAMFTIEEELLNGEEEIVQDAIGTLTL